MSKPLPLTTCATADPDPLVPSQAQPTEPTQRRAPLVLPRTSTRLMSTPRLTLKSTRLLRLPACCDVLCSPEVGLIGGVPWMLYTYPYILVPLCHTSHEPRPCAHPPPHVWRAPATRIPPADVEVGLGSIGICQAFSTSISLYIVVVVNLPGSNRPRDKRSC